MKDPNETSIVSGNGGLIGPRQFNLDPSRISIEENTTFDVWNAIAVPSVGILADLAIWITFFAMLFRLALIMFRVNLDLRLIGFYLVLLFLFIAFINVFGSQNKRKYNIVYRDILIFLSLLISTQFFWLL